MTPDQEDEIVSAEGYGPPYDEPPGFDEEYDRWDDLKGDSADSLMIQSVLGVER